MSQRVEGGLDAGHSEIGDDAVRHRAEARLRSQRRALLTPLHGVVYGDTQLGCEQRNGQNATARAGLEGEMQQGAASRGH